MSEEGQLQKRIRKMHQPDDSLYAGLVNEDKVLQFIGEMKKEFPKAGIHKIHHHDGCIIEVKPYYNPVEIENFLVKWLGRNIKDESLGSLR